MKNWIPLGMIFTAFAAIGCANVKVHKVDLQERIAGQDDHVKGFRYYLTRPYIAVGKSIPITTEYLPVALGVTDKGEYVLVSEAPLPHTAKHAVFTLEGKATDIPFASVRPLETTQTGAQGALPKSVISMQKEIVAKLMAVVKTKFTADKLAAHSNLQSELEKAVTEDKDIKRLLSNKTTFNKGKQKTATTAYTTAQASLSVSELSLSLTAEELDKVVKEVPTPLDELAGASANATFAPTPQAQPSGDTATSKTSEATKQATESPAVQVVYLPDFEEQYAIRNYNMLAKTKYAFKFRNGTELESATGSYNATDLPVKVLETFGKLVTAAGEVAKTRINPAGSGAAKATFISGGSQPMFYLKKHRAIEPGVYRVQKSWEKAAQATSVPPTQTCSFFSDLGLPLSETVTIITGVEHDEEIKALQPTGK